MINLIRTAESLYNTLTEQREIPLETKLQTLYDIIENIIDVILDIPVKLNRCEIEVQQKILELENTITILDNDLNQQRYSEINDAPINDINVIREYPHKEEYSARKCYSCKSSLHFSHLCSRNPDMDKAWLLKLWNHPLVELYCCSCHDRFEKEEKENSRIEDTELAKENLVAEEKEALIFLERRLNKDLLITEELKIENQRYSRRRLFPREFTIKNGHITGLKLSNSGLTSIPIDILVFSKLEFLDLSENLLNKIPEWLIDFKSLKFLDLTRNDCVEISESIFNKKNLIIFPPQLQMRNPMIAVINEFKQKLKNIIPLRY